MNRAEKRRQRKLARKAQKHGSCDSGTAAAAGPSNAPTLQQSLDMAVQLHHAGNLQGAEKIYRELLSADPNQPFALHLLGVIAEQVGNHEAAEELISKAIAAKPDFAEAHSNLGLSLKKRGREEEAIAHYRTAIDINPRFAEAHYNLANALKDRDQTEEALAHFRNALEISPDFAEAHNDLGLALDEKGLTEEAIGHYRTAIAIRPDFADPHNNLGNAVKATGRLDDAVALYLKAIEIRPGYAEAHYNMGIALAKLGRIDEAVARFREALDLKPDYADARSNLVFSLLYGDYPPELVFNEHKLWNDHHAGSSTVVTLRHETAADPDKPLRIGFVSGDFREHSVSYFLTPLFSARNRQTLSFHCYSTVAARYEDAVSDRLRDMADGWRRIDGQDDQAVAEMIRADGVDILVDLSGHSKGHRLPLFALKPAPVQATWLGYPGTTGLEAMDYRISDAFSDPPGRSDTCNVEKLIRLPNGCHCYRPPDDAPDVAQAPVKKNGHVTFGSFNNLSKVAPRVVAAWAAVLKAVPDARLLIKSRPLTCPGACRRYLTLFQNEGIDTGRVSLVGRSQTTRGHLGMYGDIDIALDTFPFNGVTTTCEALWMGVPVVALLGESHVARIGASLLTRVGLEALVADDVDGYVERAVALAGDLERLTGLREKMRDRLQASPLCDAEAFAADMEAAFRQMWTERCESAA